MKKFFIRILFAAPAAWLLFGACSEKAVELGRESGSDEAEVTVELPAKASGPELAYALYVFRRDGSQGSFLFRDSVVLAASGLRRRFPLSELERSSYRFLFLAVHASAPGIRTAGLSGEALRPGTAWEDLRLRRTSHPLTADAYCGVSEMTGRQILESGRIEGVLTRVVGRASLALFRIGAGGIGEPVGVQSPSVSSVLDRVSSIRFEYSGLTGSLKFGDGFALLPAEERDASAEQRIDPRLTDFRVTLPQADLGLSDYVAAAPGSARIDGAYLLPSDGTLRIRAVFTYYDTTPNCRNSHTGAHKTTCFEQGELVLELPETSSERGLSVRPDSVTLSKGGIRCDRIIDVGQSGSVSALIDWN